MAKILVVEDNYYSREILVRRLSRYGYQVVSAVDGAQALQMAHSTQPNLILLDLRLPAVDGFEVARQLKSEPEMRHIPIIAMTAYALDETRQQAFAAGCDAYETKPPDFPRLLHIIKKLLGEAGAS